MEKRDVFITSLKFIKNIYFYLKKFIIFAYTIKTNKHDTNNFTTTLQRFKSKRNQCTISNGFGLCDGGALTNKFN